MTVSETQPVNDSTPGRGWLPSPGCLFVITLLAVVASACGWIGWRAHRHQTRLEYFGQLEAHVRTEPARPVWLHDLVLRWLGEDYVAAFTDITYLNLNGTRVTDRDLQHLTGHDALRELYIDDTRITDDGLRYVGSLPNLRSLWIARTGVTDDGLPHLGNLMNLQILVLDDLQVTDAGLAHLQRLQNLRVLYLNDTAVTDGGLRHLEGLTTLRVLFVVETAVTANGAHALRSELPEIEVYPWIVDR